MWMSGDRWLITTCAGAMMFFAAAPAQAFVYWGDGDSNIGRANLDGSSVNGKFSRSPAPSVAVDSGHIYSCTSFGNILRSNIDGSGLAGIVEGVDTPQAVAVDGGHVYWANAGAKFANQPQQPGQPAPAGVVPPSIGRANLDGSEASRAFISTGTVPHGVAVDGAHVYWSDFVSGTIGRANLDGSSPDSSFITGASQPNGIAVDAGHVYWTNGASDTIGRANLDGTSPSQRFITGAKAPVAVAVDLGHVYWTNQPFTGYTASIGRANLDGSRPDQSFVAGLVSPLTGLAVDALTAAPSSVFTFTGKALRKNGVTSLQIVVPGPGRVTTAQVGVTKRKPALITAVSVRVAKAGAVTLKFSATTAGKRVLASKGKFAVKAKITYTPTGGTPKTKVKPVTLARVKYIR